MSGLQSHFMGRYSIVGIAVSLILAGCSQVNAEKPMPINEGPKIPVVKQKVEVKPLPAEPVSKDVVILQKAKPKEKLTKTAEHSARAEVELVHAPGIASKALVVRGMVGIPQVEASTENYQDFDSNGVVLVSEQPVSTFSADVDTASYANMRRFINNGRLPPKDSIRVEELINYFNYNYPSTVSEEQPVSIHTTLSPSLWLPEKQLLKIGVSAYQPDVGDRADSNLVFLIDVSGSMRNEYKLPLVKRSLMLMLSQLRESDRISIVTYSGKTEVLLPSTLVKDRFAIEQAISGLNSGGSTYGEAGIKLAYQQAKKGFVEGGINQIMLMSDGDLNVGLTDINLLKDMIEIKRRSGIQFSTYGFGQGNYNDHLMEQLADIGNGTAAYIDSLHEAQKLLVDQLGSQLQTVAHDVKFQVEFNPALVAEYRLIGYENRQLKRTDFNDDKKDAAELGAGHTVTAIYEITPTGQKGSVDPLVFQKEPEAKLSNDTELAEVRIRYKTKFGAQSEKVTKRIHKNALKEYAELSQDDQFAIAVAAFGQKLRHNSELSELSFSEIRNWANKGKGADPFGYRAEFVRLVNLASSLSKTELPMPTKEIHELPQR